MSDGSERLPGAAPEPTPTHDGPPSGRLESWKEIAAYLRRDVRTVQRWEQRERLPVHRHMHADRATVWTSAAELDLWIRRRGPAQGADAAGKTLRSLLRRDRWRFWAPAGMLLVAISIAAVWVAPDQLPPSAAPRAAEPPGVARLFANLTREGGAGARLTTDVQLAAGISSPDGRTLYLSATADDVLLIADTASMTVTGRHTITGHPGPLAVSADGRRLYVGTFVGRLHVLDTVGGTTTVIDTGGPIADVLATEDGRFVYLALQYAGLARLDIETGQIQKVPTVGCPMALAAKGRRLYVSHQCRGPGGTDGHDAVGIFDLATGALQGRVQGPPQVGGPLGLSPDGAFFWLNGKDACSAGRYDRLGCPSVPSSILHVYNTGDLTLARTVTFPEAGTLGSVAVLPGGSRAFVGGANGRVIDTRDFAVVESLGRPVVHLPAFAPDRRTAWLFAEHEVVRVSPLPPSCDLPQIGLMDHWPADGAADDIRADLHGTRMGGNDYRPGIVGRAFAFDGKDDGIQVGREHDPDWAFGGRDGTLLAWVKFASLEGEMPLIERTGLNGAPSPGWRLSKSSDQRATFCMGRPDACEPGPGFSGLAGATILRADAWYHVAVTRRHDTVTLYVNGRPDVEPASLPFVQDDKLFEKRFGVDRAGRRLHGLLDEVAHYTRALDRREIDTLYRNATAPACTGPSLFTLSSSSANTPGR